MISLFSFSGIILSYLESQFTFFKKVPYFKNRNMLALKKECNTNTSLSTQGFRLHFNILSIYNITIFSHIPADTGIINRNGFQQESWVTIEWPFQIYTIVSLHSCLLIWGLKVIPIDTLLPFSRLQCPVFPKLTVSVMLSMVSFLYWVLKNELALI